MLWAILETVGFLVIATAIGWSIGWVLRAWSLQVSVRRDWNRRIQFLQEKLRFAEKDLVAYQTELVKRDSLYNQLKSRNDEQRNLLQTTQDKTKDLFNIIALLRSEKEDLATAQTEAQNKISSLIEESADLTRSLTEATTTVQKLESVTATIKASLAHRETTQKQNADQVIALQQEIETLTTKLADSKTFKTQTIVLQESLTKAQKSHQQEHSKLLAAQKQWRNSRKQADVQITELTAQVNRYKGIEDQLASSNIELEDYKRKTDDLTQQVKEYTNIQTEIAANKQALATSRQQLAASQLEIDNQTTILQSSREKYKLLALELSAARKDLTSAKEQQIKIAESRDSFQNQWEQQLATQREKESVLASIQQKLTTSQQELAIAQQGLAASQQENTNQTAILQSSREKYKQIALELSAERDNLEKAKVATEELQRQVNDFQKQLQTYRQMESDLANIEAKYEDTKDIIRQRDAQLSDLRAKVTGYQSIIAESKTLAESHAQNYAELQQKNTELTERSNQMATQAATKRENLSGYKAEVESLKITLGDYDQKMTEQRNAIVRWKADFSTIQQSYQQLKDRLASYETRETQWQQKQTEWQQAQTTYAGYATKIDDLQQEIIRLRQDKDDGIEAKKTILALQTTIGDLQATTNHLQTATNDVTLYKNKVETLQTRIHEAEESIALRDEQIASQQTMLSELKNSNHLVDSLETTIRNKQAKIDELELLLISSPKKKIALAKRRVIEIAKRTRGEGPVRKDDLKQIRGIGPVLEKTLHGLGITSFQQIAKFESQDIEFVATALNAFPDRILRDDWITGATQCHTNKYGKKP